MTDSEFQEFLQQSIGYLDEQQFKGNKEFKLDDFHRVDYEQETGIMTFSDVGVVPKVVARFQIAGTLSRKSNTWLWAWDNPYLLDNVVEKIHKVREFGEQNRIKKLTDPKWDASEKDAWEMTAISAHILMAKGAFTMPSDDIQAFIVFTDIRWVGKDSKVD